MVKQLKPYCELFRLLGPHSLQDGVPVDRAQGCAVLLQAVALCLATLLAAFPAR